MIGTTCPNCGADGCRPFYSVSSVPTNSCLMLDTRAEALKFPTSDIVLAFCSTCGFIFNAVWEPEQTIYSDRYEETQGFSPTFMTFSRALAQNLIDQYSIRGKNVLEIGCGKGEFLNLICQLGGNRGVGYDPAFVPERQSTECDIRFVREFFTEETKEAAPELLCCKMTLEHIGQTRRFMESVRVVATRPGSVIFFQVPDAGRILGEAAFWDIYYEHCSYFSAASLRHLFASTHFEPQRVWTDYDGQYLMIVATPTSKVGHQHGDAASGREDEVAAVARATHIFASAVTRSRTAWIGQLRAWAVAGQRTVLWGSGSKAVAFLTTLGIYDELSYAVDVNPYRAGKYLPVTGQQIVTPAFLRDYRPDNVVVMNPIYRQEVSHELAHQGCAPALYTVLDVAKEPA